MIFNYLALFSVAASFDAVYGFTTILTPASSPSTIPTIQTSSLVPTQFARTVLHLSDADDSSDEVAAEEPVVSDSEEASPTGPDKKRHTLFVGNIPFATTDSQLRDVFAEQGSVETVIIPRDRITGIAKGFAFVDMSSQEEMESTIAALHQSDYGGRSMRVQASLPKDEAQKQAKQTDDEGTQKIYVGNLSFESTKEDITEYYSRFGKVKDLYMPVNLETGAPRGFAFVSLDQEVAEKAIEGTDEKYFMGRTLSVSKPLPRGEKIIRQERGPRQKLYVGNLSFYTVAATLKELFQEFGTVHDCYLPEDPDNGGSRGFGFVTIDKEFSDAAVAGTDGCELDGRIIRVNEAQPKGPSKQEDQADNDNAEVDWSADAAATSE